MSQQNVEVIRSVYDAFESRDMDSVLAEMDTEIEVFATEGLPWSGRYRGHDGFEQFIQNVEDHVSFTIETQELIESGTSVAQIGRLDGEAHATGERFNLRAIHIWGLADGKVVSFHNYPDTREQRRALGLPEDEEASDSIDGGDKNREPFWS